MHIVDFAIICALEEEARAVLEKFPDAKKAHTPNRKRWFTVVKNDGKYYRLVIVELGSMGNLNAQQACQEVIAQLSPHVVFLVGICGGILPAAPNYRRGDVVISTEVVYYEPAKYWPRKTEPRDIVFSAIPPEGFDVFLQETPGWREEIHVPRPGDPEGRLMALVKSGRVLSGEKVIASSIRAKELHDRHPKALSVEMESAGVASACTAAGVFFVIIKAVSDSANNAKSKVYRRYAAAAAAAFVATGLRKGPIPDLPTRNHRPLELANELLGIVKASESVVVLPGRSVTQVRDKAWENYPPSDHDVDYDDMLSIFRIAPAVSWAARNGRISYVFDHRDDVNVHVSQAGNVIYVGSGVSNQLTDNELKNALLYFGGNNTRSIVSRDKKVTYDAKTCKWRAGHEQLIKDYGLLSVFHRGTQTRVVLGGCRAYGQIVVGEFLTDPVQLEMLLHLVGGADFQCVIGAEIAGHLISEYAVERLVVRPKARSPWQEVKIPERRPTQIHK